jgi:hypothetical protein
MILVSDIIGNKGNHNWLQKNLRVMDIFHIEKYSIVYQIKLLGTLHLTYVNNVTIFDDKSFNCLNLV